jgi:hypothetical protein
MTLDQLMAALAVASLCITVGGIIWKLAQQSARIQELLDWRRTHEHDWRLWQEKHEPVRVQLATLQEGQSHIAATLIEIKTDMQRLWERKPTTGARQ